MAIVCMHCTIAVTCNREPNILDLKKKKKEFHLGDRFGQNLPKTFY